MNHHRRRGVTELRYNLHWLPIEQRIKFKVGVMVFNSLEGKAPKYMTDLFQEKLITERYLRSNDNYRELVLPRTKKRKCADRSISVEGARFCNSLPNVVKRSNTTEQFKCRLKTHLFKEAYTDK